MWHEIEESLEEESETIWLLPSMIDATRLDESSEAATLGDHRTEPNTGMIRRAGDSRGRLSLWLQAIESVEDPALASLEMPHGPSVEFAVHRGRIVSMPYVDGLFLMDEHYLDEIDDADTTGATSIETVFVRLLERATLFELEPLEDFDAEEIAIEPLTLSERMYEADASSPVWKTFEQLHEHSDLGWMWRRLGADFHLTRHIGDATLAGAHRVLEGVRSLLASFARTEPMGNVVLSGPNESWHLCWDDDWFFLERNVFVGRVLDSLDHVFRFA